MEKYAVYFISRASAKIFANVQNELIASFPTEARAKEFCDHLNQCGYMDDQHVGYEVRITI
jgi:hypothetical protein